MEPEAGAAALHLKIYPMFKSGVTPEIKVISTFIFIVILEMTKQITK